MADTKKQPPAQQSSRAYSGGLGNQAVPQKSKSFVFIGDRHGQGPEKITLFDLEFEKNGKPVKVEDPHAIGKLENNSHFKAA